MTEDGLSNEGISTFIQSLHEHFGELADYRRQGAGWNNDCLLKIIDVKSFS